ncbi:glutathione S-transferase [Thiomicrorhabdus sp. ZW0627]|uniref:glutathione S-transferase n=1 Tax=Thiomicrorhabdus sp. ZW0627 TaxID=3039774 RepID=UPI0024363D58|nr:glutathione S-transferase [Thiomicrorhabdus sp. ZW0627]MDG6774814.1 glutathione S-transferase [Thiomicrorhabdus sp. ZW0627]
MENHPVLYSYRRCPYAMRARMGIYLSGMPVEQREIVFWDKPADMLEASPKGTVPVLVLENGDVIDESRDILQWALQQKGDSILLPEQPDLLERMNAWIDENDGKFKMALDHYKYADRYPEYPQEHYRRQGEAFLAKLEQTLLTQPYLLGAHLSMADLAIFPFIRQFANVDKLWFAESGYKALRQWLENHLSQDYFLGVMKNRPVWESGHSPLWVDEPELQRRDEFTDKARQA